MASKMYSLASCVMLFYDIALTMPDEVEKIWMQPQYTYMTLLWTLVSILLLLAPSPTRWAFFTKWMSEKPSLK